MRSKKIARQCPVCGKIFFCSPEGQGAKTCCSRECARALRTSQTSETRTCRVCGREFSVPRSAHDRTCPECMARIRSERDRRRGLAGNLRPCHDCGRLGHNYRCPACWERRRKGLGLQVEDE